MMKYLRDAEGKFATWVKVVALTMSFLSAAVAYGKLTGTVVANTKTISEMKAADIALGLIVNENELNDARVHTELTVTLGAVLAELKEIKQEIKAGNSVQKRMYGEIANRDVTQPPLKAEKKELPKAT